MSSGSAGPRSSSSRARRRRGVVAAAAGAGDDAGPPRDDDDDGDDGGGDADPPRAPSADRDSWDEDDQDLDAQATAAVDKLLGPAWRGLKDAAERELAAAARAAASDGDAEAAAEARRAAERVRGMSTLSEALDGDALLRSLAESELGPLLESMGLPRARALPFLYDLARTAAAVQLAAAAAVFYGAEYLFRLDSGEAWRCVAGLGIGYVARLGIPVEALAWPLYDALVRAATGGRGYYRPSAGGGAGAGGAGEEEEKAGGGGAARAPPRRPAQQPPQRGEQARTALARLGALFAAAALLPPVLFHWSQREGALQFGLPALAGALAFDAAYLVALVLKLREAEEGGGGGGGVGWGD